MQFTPVGSAAQTPSTKTSSQLKMWPIPLNVGCHQALCLSAAWIPVPPTRMWWKETYPCTLLGFGAFTEARSQWIPRQHIWSACAYKTKDILLPMGEYTRLRGCFSLPGSISTSRTLLRAWYLINVVKLNRKGTKTIMKNIFDSWRQPCVEAQPHLGENAVGA